MDQIFFVFSQFGLDPLHISHDLHKLCRNKLLAESLTCTNSLVSQVGDFM